MASWAWFQAAEADEASSKEPPQGSGTMEWRSDISIEENLLELRERDRTTMNYLYLEHLGAREKVSLVLYSTDTVRRTSYSRVQRLAGIYHPVRK